MNEQAFRELVMAYCDHDDQIRACNKTVKELRAAQKETGEAILNYMKQRSLDVCNAGARGVLTVKTTTSKAPLNADTIRDNLSQVFAVWKGSSEMDTKGVDELATKAAEFVCEHRETEDRQ
eukprot:920582-Pyramimonas_sp.AAC.1